MGAEHAADDVDTFDDYVIKDQYSGEHYHAGFGFDEDGYTFEPTNVKPLDYKIDQGEDY